MGGNYFIKDNEECWESDLKHIKNCDKAPESIIIYLKPNIKRKIDILMDKYKNREWLAYLIGKDNIIEDMFFPKQNATSGRVDEINFPSGVKVIGVIHSHHSMGASFSHTDDNYINGNHDISIVVSHNSITGQVRWNTPCGCKKIVTAKIRIFMQVDFDEKSFIDDVESKMEIPVATQRFNQYGLNFRDEWSDDNTEEFVDDRPSAPSLREALEGKHN